MTSHILAVAFCMVAAFWLLTTAFGFVSHASLTKRASAALYIFGALGAIDMAHQFGAVR